MSFIIAIHVSEGFVMASDSRITFTSTEPPINGIQTVKLGTHISDTTYKTFLTPNNVGISTCGEASLNNHPITGDIEAYMTTHVNENVEQMKDSIRSYFRNIKQDLNTTFILTGYLINDEGRYIPHCYRVNIANDSVEDCSNSYAIWDGERDVMSRLATALYIKDETGNFQEHHRNDILWQYFTLQDAIDFARYAVQVTIDTMRFQKTVKTVGGPVDILVIRPEGGRWISRKELK